MAVLFKSLASALLVAALTQGAFGAPKNATRTRGLSESTDPVGSSSINSVVTPKRDVELTDSIPTETPPTSASTSSSTHHSDCPPEAYDGPSNTTVLLLETRAHQLDGEYKTPNSSVVEALGEIRTQQAAFAIASIGFKAMGPIAQTLAWEADLPCSQRKRMLKLFTERNARLTKKVADAYGVLASKVREAIAKKGEDADSRLQSAADQYDSLRATYLQAHERAERQRVAAMKLTTYEDLPNLASGVLTSNELTRSTFVHRQAV